MTKAPTKTNTKTKSTKTKPKPAAKAPAKPVVRPTSVTKLRQVLAALDRSQAAVQAARDVLVSEIVRLTP